MIQLHGPIEVGQVNDIERGEIGVEGMDHFPIESRRAARSDLTPRVEVLLDLKKVSAGLVESIDTHKESDPHRTAGLAAEECAPSGWHVATPLSSRSMQSKTCGSRSRSNFLAKR